MTYRLIQLAPGAYDLILHGNVVASVVRNGSCAFRVIVSNDFTAS